MASKLRDSSSFPSKPHSRQSNTRNMMIRRNILNINHMLTSRYGHVDNYCRYLHRFCLQSRLEGYGYCIRHIMHCDRSSSFKACNFANPQTGKRCLNAARRLDRRDMNFCYLHTRQFNLSRRKQTHLQIVRRLPEDQRDCLKRKFDELEHYCSSNEHDHRRKHTHWELPEDKGATTSRSLKNKINESIAKLAIQNQSDDDINSIQLGDTLDLEDSDHENVESYMDDPLRHSGVYSAEEIAHTLRNKMLRLQTLYINLLSYYKNILKNKMRQYYQTKCDKTNQHHKKNHESILNSIKEDEDLKLLKAMQKYHSLWGAEKVVKDTALEMRRLLVNDEEKSSDNQSGCIYKKDNVTCNQKCVPLSHYCKTHILYDNYQILYRPCAAGDPSCLNPVISYVHKNTCISHTQVKYSKSDICNILKSPTRPDSTSNNQAINGLVNEGELFQSMEEFNIDGVSSGNLEYSNLGQFDLDGNAILP